MQLFMIGIPINSCFRENSQDLREMVLACNTILMERLSSRDTLEMTNTMDGGITAFIQANIKKGSMMGTVFCQQIIYIMRDIFIEDSLVEKEFILLELKWSLFIRLKMWIVSCPKGLKTICKLWISSKFNRFISENGNREGNTDLEDFGKRIIGILASSQTIYPMDWELKRIRRLIKLHKLNINWE